jgi:signal peptidase
VKIMNSTNLAKANPPLSSLGPAARRFGWIILTMCLLGTYLLVNFVMPGIDSGNLNLYILQSALWLGIAFLAFWLWSAEDQHVRLLEHRSMILSAAMIGGIQVAVSIVFGFLAGFGNSPYAHTFFIILLNLWYVVTKLVGIETARWYLGKTIGRINAGLGYVIAWLVPFLLLIPLGKFSLLGEAESTFRLVGGTLIPAASENLLAAYLAISAGPLASIAYLGVMQLFEWLSPLLPDLPWLGAAFVGALVPLLGLMMLNSQETEQANQAETQPETKNKGEGNASAGSWLLVLMLAVGVIWLNSGALGVRPSLISGNSMNPMLYPGDVVITRVISPEQIQVGDVIRFHRDGIDVVHRVKEVRTNGSTLVFVTRGDNNNVDDSPIMTDQLEGKVIMAIPKVGWVGIFFRQALASMAGTP